MEEQPRTGGHTGQWISPKATAILRSQGPYLPFVITVRTFPTPMCHFKICSFPTCVQVAHMDFTYKRQVQVFILCHNNCSLSAFYVPGIELNAFSYFMSFSHYLNRFKVTTFITILLLRKFKCREVKSLIQSHTANNKVRLEFIFFEAKISVFCIVPHLPLTSI